MEILERILDRYFDVTGVWPEREKRPGKGQKQGEDQTDTGPIDPIHTHNILGTLGVPQGAIYLELKHRNVLGFKHRFNLPKR